MGASGVGGAEKGYIRTWKQRVLFFSLNFVEGGSAARTTPAGCFGHKKVQLGVLIKEYTLPQVFQLGVFRVGDVLIGSVPVEPTTEVGALIRERILGSGPDGVGRALAVSLANGYGSYVASAQEYEAQYYEGGSTLYGPNTGEMLADELGQLATSLRSGSPTVRVDAALAFPVEGKIFSRLSHPSSDHLASVATPSEARDRVVLFPIIVLSALQRLDHVEKALHAGGGARALVHPPRHEHGIACVLIHLPLPGENRFGDVGKAVPQKATIGQMAQAFGDPGRADDISEQEDAGLPPLDSDTAL